MSRHLAIPFVVLLALGAAPTAVTSGDVDRPVENAARFRLQDKPHNGLPTLFLVGDSTMKTGTPGQRGWGDDLAAHFDLARINVLNQAIGGRSSRTYMTEGRWDAVLAMVSTGDYAIIQFGHNDAGPVNEKPPVTASTRARGTIRGVGDESQEIDNILTGKREVVHTYGWYLRKYALDVKAKGATPIIFSLTPRNVWKDGRIVRARPSGYADWAEQAARATGAIFVDHNEVIARELDGMGPEQALKLFADGKLHTSPEGASFNARMAAVGLRALSGLPLAEFLKQADAESAAAREERLQWWREARFGMFVHWGVSSHLGGVWQGQRYGGYAEHIQRAFVMTPVTE